MNIVTDVTIEYDDQTHIVTFTVTKQELVSHPSGHAVPSQPVVTVTEIDLSDLVL
jgi:hypothetical protein